VRDLEEVRAASDVVASEIQGPESVVFQHVLIGWMNLLRETDGGAGQPFSTALPGMLSLEFEGQRDTITRITDARAAGLNDSLRLRLSGRPLRDWTDPATQDALGFSSPMGVSIVAISRMGGPSFPLSQRAAYLLREAGILNESRPGVILAGPGGEHGIALDRLELGQDWGAETSRGPGMGPAAHWFLDNIKPATALIEELRNLVLPEVTA
jgi:hypothetical protein